MATNQEATVEPDESQTTMSYHPHEGSVEDVMGWLEEYVEEQPLEDGTSSHPPPKKEKQKVLRSPRKKLVTSIVFPHILEWV